jgi:hypothetical protein
MAALLLRQPVQPRRTSECARNRKLPEDRCLYPQTSSATLPLVVT